MELSRREALNWTVSAGTLAVAGNLLAAEEKKSADWWRAWAVTEGDQTKLVVEGIYSQGGPGVVAFAKEAAPQGINPKILILDLKTATLPGVWTLQLIPIPASFTKSPYKKGQYDSIHIRYPDGTSVMIKTITDATAGPK